MSESDIYTCPTCEAINDVCGCPVPPPPERAILSDLIAELRPYERYHYVDTRVLGNAADRAEVRLKGLSNE